MLIWEQEVSRMIPVGIRKKPQAGRHRPTMIIMTVTTIGATQKIPGIQETIPLAQVQEVTRQETPIPHSQKQIGTTFFSADSYEDGTSNNNTVSQNNSSETARAADHQNSNDTLYNIENTEQQIADISPTPIPSPTPTMTPIPSISPTPTPVSEIQKNILTVPQKEEELTEEECRQKMQLIYCRKEIRNAAEAEIIPDRSRVIAVVSIRINGKEADWHWRSSRILLKLNPQEMQTEIETAIMCRKELSWTEAKKNAILTYNIF